MIDRAYAAALDLLRQHRPTLDALAAALFAAGYLDRSEIDAVLAKTPLHKEEKAEATAAQTTRQSTPLLEHDETTIAATEPPSPGPAIIIEA